MKLVIREPESDDLLRALRAIDAPPVASALARVELRRAVAEAGGTNRIRDRADAVLDALELLVLDDPLLDAAGRLAIPGLRSLDAIHIASAALLGDTLHALVTYDRRMLRAAMSAGLPVAAPGAEVDVDEPPTG